MSIIESIRLASVSGAWNTAWPILVAILLFLVMIVIHELGHFTAAKLLGVKVNEFSVGFGPAIFKKKGKETLYALRLIPFGGFCAMEGEDEESSDGRAFCNKAPWRRFIIVAAGAIFNIIFGLILVAFLVIPKQTFTSTTVASFGENYVSGSAGGLMVGDEILEINGRNVNNDFEINYNFTNIGGEVKEMPVLIEGGKVLTDKEGKAVTVNTLGVDVLVERGGQEVLLESVPFACKSADGMNYLLWDFNLQTVEKNFFTVLAEIFKTTFSYVKIVIWSLFDLLTGKFGLSAMGGPVAVTDQLGQAARSGLSTLLPILCLITVNLGVFNLLPVPALDGGRLVFIVAEMIFRRPIAKKYEPYIHAAGLVLLLGLIGVVTINDIIRLIKG